MFGATRLRLLSNLIHTFKVQNHQINPFKALQPF